MRVYDKTVLLGVFAAVNHFHVGAGFLFVFNEEKNNQEASV